jgi:hypothetical protein
MRSFHDPDERRVLAGGRVVVDVVTVGEMPVQRVSHAPGWRWSVHSSPDVGTARCPNTHVGVLISGRLHVEEGDGTSGEAGPGDLLVILPGHDAWTVGDEPAVLIQFDEGASAARRFGLVP